MIPSALKAVFLLLYALHNFPRAIQPFTEGMKYADVNSVLKIWTINSARTSKSSRLSLKELISNETVF